MCACNVAGALFKGLTSLLRYGHIRCKLGQVSSCTPGFWPRLSTNPQTSEGLPGKARRNTSWDHLTYCSCWGSSDKPCSETVYKITQVTLAQCTASLSSPGWEVLRQHTSRVDNAKMHLQDQQRRTRCPKHAVVSNISRTSWELLVLEMTSILAQIERCSEHIFASPADEAEQHTHTHTHTTTGVGSHRVLYLLASCLAPVTLRVPNVWGFDAGLELEANSQKPSLQLSFRFRSSNEQLPSPLISLACP